MTGPTALRVNGSAALASIDVGTGSHLTVNGTLTVSNGGHMRFVAGAGAANNTYSPMTITTWSSTSGAYQAVGCVWNGTTAKTVTVNSAVDGTAGSPTSLNTSTNQRVLITDSAGGTSVGVGFLFTEGAVSLTAATADTSSLAVPGGLPVLDAWAFSGVSGVGASDPAYLSLSLPAAYSAAFCAPISAYGAIAGAGGARSRRTT